MEYTAELAHADVERGAAWLDQQCPDWFKEIKVERLNLTSTTYCVLGQTARCLLGKKPNGSAMRDGYDMVLWSHPAAIAGSGWPEKHGFNVRSAESKREIMTAYEMLTIAWREYIRQRLESA